MPKLSLVSQKGSKFSDTEPGSSSPLQRSTLRFISKVSPDSSKASKSARLNNVSHTNGNRLTRSSSSLRTRKEEKNSVTPDPKASMSRIRRLSEPKGTIYHNSSGKSGSANIVARRRVSERSEIKNSSSTLNIDKLKSSVVSEVKVRVSKTSAVNVQRKPAEEITQKSDDIITRNLSKDLANVSSHQDVDDNPIVEKTVVMLEREKPAALVFDALKDRVGAHMQSNAHNEVGKPEEDPAVPPPASPIIAVKEVDKLTSNCVGKEPSHTRLIEVILKKTPPSFVNHSFWSMDAAKILKCHLLFLNIFSYVTYMILSYIASCFGSLYYMYYLVITLCLAIFFLSFVLDSENLPPRHARIFFQLFYVKIESSIEIMFIYAYKFCNRVSPFLHSHYTLKQCHERTCVYIYIT